MNQETEDEVVDAEFEVIPDNEMNELEREHYQEILRLNRDVKLKQMKYDIAKGEAKARKEDLECASLELSNLIADGPRKPDPQKELPFSEPQDWEGVAITDALKLTGKQREKLDELGITTVGQFEFIRSGRDPQYPDGIRSIKGFGNATVDAMENDIVNWLQVNAREKEAAADEPESE